MLSWRLKKINFLQMCHLNSSVLNENYLSITVVAVVVLLRIQYLTVTSSWPWRFTFSYYILNKIFPLILIPFESLRDRLNLYQCEEWSYTLIKWEIWHIILKLCWRAIKEWGNLLQKLYSGSKYGQFKVNYSF